MTNTASVLAKGNVKKVVMDGMNGIVKRLVIYVKEGKRKLIFSIYIEYKVIWLMWNKSTQFLSKYTIILESTPFYSQLL